MITRPFRLRLRSSFRLPLQPSPRPASSFSVSSRAILQPCKPLSSNNRGRLKSTKAVRAGSHGKAVSADDVGHSPLDTGAGASCSASSTVETSPARSHSQSSSRLLHTSSTQTVHPPRRKDEGEGNRSTSPLKMWLGKNTTTWTTPTTLPQYPLRPGIIRRKPHGILQLANPHFSSPVRFLRRLYPLPSPTSCSTRKSSDPVRLSHIVQQTSTGKGRPNVSRRQ